jgi:hypothetical protein
MVLESFLSNSDIIDNMRLYLFWQTNITMYQRRNCDAVKQAQVDLRLGDCEG